MKIKIKNDLLDGVRIGLKSFIILYVFAILISVVLNLTVVESLKDYLLGTMDADIGFSFPVVFKLAAFIMNISFFHSTGDMYFGFIAFIILPFFAFLLSIRDKDGLSILDNIIRFSLSSLILSTLILLVSFLLRGEMIGVSIDFVSFRNFLVSFFLSIVLQLLITFNRHLDSFEGIYLTKNFLKYSFIFTIVASFVGIAFFVSKYLHNIFLIFVIALALVPNVAVYLFFAMFGVPLIVSDQMQAAMDFAGVNVNILQMPLMIRMILIAFLIIIIVLTFMSKGEEVSVKSLVGFSILTSILCLVISVITYIDVGNMIKLLDVKLYIDNFAAFILPFTYIAGFSVVYLLVLKVSK